MDYKKTAHDALIVPAGQGRRYEMGGMTSLFLADGAETNDRYSISEWWLEPHQTGPGAHVHEANDDIFYVLQGSATFWLNGKKMLAQPGTFIRAPAGVSHDFANESDARVGLLNIYIPGGFEQDMPAIVEWFKTHP